mgnify:FL=1
METAHVELGESLDACGERARRSAGAGNDEGSGEGEDLVVVQGAKNGRR